MKLKCDELLSSFAFNFNLRHYTVAGVASGAARLLQTQVGRCRLNLSNPCRKRLELQLKLKYDKLLSSFAFNFNLRRYTQAAAVALQTDEEFAASDPTQVLKQAAAVTVVMQGSALREAGAYPYTRPLFCST